MTDVPHNYCDCMMHLITVQKFRKVNLIPQNKSVAFSQHDIRILCENTHAQSEVQKIFFVKTAHKNLHKNNASGV